MPKSLRAHLLVWYTAILALVITAFATMVCYLAWRSLLADIDADLEARVRVIAAALRPAGADRFDLDMPPEYIQTDPGAGPYYAIWSAAGEIVDRSDPDLQPPLPSIGGTRTRDGRREAAVVTSTGATILVGRSLASARGQIWSLAGLIGGVGLAALALSLAGGWLLVSRALAPINRISQTARAMVAGELGARIPLDRLETELAHVARALNDAFDRLHGLIEQERRFTADASHELRTPLTTLATEIEWALGRERSTVEYRDSLEVCGRAGARMRSVVESLLMLARADAGEVRLRWAPVRVDAIVGDAVALVQSLAERRELTIDFTAEPVTAQADADRLAEAVTNVLANAVHYNRDGGRIEIAVRQVDGSTSIVVADTGIGIAAEDVPHVFERFFRADRARRSDQGGVGLGLALARWVIEAHGGTITCVSALGRGSTFTIRLPLSHANDRRP